MTLNSDTSHQHINSNKMYILKVVEPVN